MRRTAAIGGGHGLSRTLQALTRLSEYTTAIVTVADDGGSSGRLRRDLGVPAPGDLRMALTSMAPAGPLRSIVEHRWDRGELDGHSLGNLMLVALLEQQGNLVTALDELGRLLHVPGRVLPCTREPVTLHARTADGDVHGQERIAGRRGIEQVWLEPSIPAVAEEAVEALLDAELIVLGPGSLFTSLLPNLLVPGIAGALAEADAPVVLVSNLREQPGETEGLDLVGHLEALHQHVPGLRVDGLVLHEGSRPSGPGAVLEATDDQVRHLVGQVARVPLLDGGDGHDPELLAAALARAWRDRPQVARVHSRIR
ncbi:MAG: gluconeogenesis factor YvcK family protein [Nitriliruptoraceae bacterium]